MDYLFAYKDGEYLGSVELHGDVIALDEHGVYVADTGGNLPDNFEYLDKFPVVSVRVDKRPCSSDG